VELCSKLGEVRSIDNVTIILSTDAGPTDDTTLDMSK